MVGLLILRMGYAFAADAMHDLMDRAADSDKEHEIKALLLSTPGSPGFMI